MSTLPGTSDAQFFYQCLESCALHPQSSGGIRGSANDSVRILGKVESQDPKFQKKYLKLIERRTDPGHAHNRLCENSIGALRLGSGRTVKHFILVTPKPVRAEVLEV